MEGTEEGPTKRKRKRDKVIECKKIQKKNEKERERRKDEEG